MRGFLTGVLVLLWIACLFGAVHSARYPHPRILRYGFDVMVRAGLDIVVVTGLLFWLWRTFLR